MVSSIPLILDVDNDGNIRGLKQASEISVGSITSVDFSVEGLFQPASISATTISAVDLAVDNINLDITALADVDDNLFVGGEGKYLFVSAGAIVASSVSAAGSLSALTDVDFGGGPTLGQVLTYSGPGKWTASTSPAGVTTFTALTDTPGAHSAGKILLDNGTGVIFEASTVLATSADLNSHTGDGTIHFTEGSITHANIGGLDSDDHPQYTLSATNANLSSTVNSHIGDTTIHYLLSSKSLSDIGDVSSVTPSVGQVLTFGAAGKWAPSTSPVGVTDHGLLTGLDDDDHPQYTLSATNANLSSTVSTHIADGTIHFTEGSIDHGSIAGLTDDDHERYFDKDGTKAATGNFSTRNIVAQGTRQYNTSAWNIVEASTVSATVFQINSGGFAGIDSGESILSDFSKLKFVDLTGTPASNENSIYVKEYTGGGGIVADVVHFHRDDGSETILAQIDADTTGVIVSPPGAPTAATVYSTWNKDAINNTFLNKFGNSTVSGNVTVSGDLTVLSSVYVSGDLLINGTVDGRDISTDGSNLDNHIADGTIHFTEGSIDHGSIAGLSDNDHPQYVLSSTNANLSSTVSTHIADGTIHFTEGSIDHGSIAGLTDNDHPQYVLSATNNNLSSTVTDHLASASVHFTEASIDHGSIAGLSDDDHSQYVLATGARDITGSQIISGILTASGGVNTSGNITLSGSVRGALGREQVTGHLWLPVFARNSTNLTSIHLQINFGGSQALSIGLPYEYITSSVVLTFAQNTHTIAPEPLPNMRVELWYRPYPASSVTGILIASAGPLSALYTATAVPFTDKYVWRDLSTGNPTEITLPAKSNIYMYVESNQSISSYITCSPVLYSNST